jgi:hypothetical protein
LLSDNSVISVVQEIIPVVVDGMVSQVNTTYKHPVRASDFKVRNRNSIQVVKRNTEGTKPDVKQSEKKKDHKAMLLGDNHVHGLTSRLSDILNY